jgi:hypothetical protein
MFGSVLLDVAIGLSLIYLLFSTVCSALSEIIEGFLKNRAKDLERGIRELLSAGPAAGQDQTGPADNSAVAKIYNHPLIYSLFAGDYQPASAKKWYERGVSLPSYIPARNFALALMDLALPGTASQPSGAAGATQPAASATSPSVVINNAVTPPAAASAAPAPNPVAALRSAILNSNVLNRNTRQALVALIDAAGDDIVQVRQNIESWFNTAMDRVSGWYKRRTQLVLFCLALIVAGAVNVDTVTIVNSLSTDKSLRDSLVASAEEYAKQTAASSAAAGPSAQTASTGAPQGAAGSTAATGSTGQTGATAQGSTGGTGTTGAIAAGAATGVTGSQQQTPAATCDASCRLKTNMDQLKALGLPLGWSNEPMENNPRGVPGSLEAWLLKLLGCLLTAAAVSLGAPFWFDLLNKFVVVRSTVKPHEKSPEEPSKD